MNKKRTDTQFDLVALVGEMSTGESYSDESPSVYSRVLSVSFFHRHSKIESDAPSE